MKNEKLLIVEDEQIIAENLRLILNEYGYEFVDVAMDPDEVRVMFEKHQYDLVLMDINLGDSSPSDGVDLIRWLKKKYIFTHLYVTANADAMTVQKAKSTIPSGYIVKPFINSSIYANVEIAMSNLTKNIFFTYSEKGMQRQINLTEIFSVQADGAYINVHMINSKKLLLRKALTEFQEEYSSTFIRIHKSIIINKNHIQAYNSKFVKVDDENLALGRAYKQTFLEQIEGMSFER